jgi:hypothetical protein
LSGRRRLLLLLLLLLPLPPPPLLVFCSTLFTHTQTYTAAREMHDNTN